MPRETSRVQKTALLGLLFALAMALSFLESSVAGLMALPPGVKPGLSNIVVLFAMLAFGGRSALLLAALKSLFALLTRGPVGALLSLAGGACSVGGMVALVRSRRVTLSCQTVSAVGGVLHNAGQLAAAALLIKNRYLLYYLPVLLVSGVVSGLVTGTLFRAVQPYLGRLAGRP